MKLRGGKITLAPTAAWVTLSYDPAMPSDESLVALYGGNILSVPPYLLNVKPVLRVNGNIAAIGDSIGLGKDQTLVLSFAGPDGDIERVTNLVTAGNYSAIVFQAQATPVTTPAINMARLIENSKKVNSPDISLDDLLGQMLYSIGVSYFDSLSLENEVYAKTLQVINLHQPSEAMVTDRVNVKYLFGLPNAVTEGGINMDVDRNINSVFSRTQDKERENAFMILSGLSSSAWESKILEAFFDVPSVSAVQVLKLASEQSIPIYTITNLNINDILPELEVTPDLTADIINAVNTGKRVIIPKQTLH